MTRSFRSIAFALVAGVGACGGGQGRVVQAPVDLAIAPIGSMPDSGVAPSGTIAPSNRCSVRLVAEPIEKSSPGCYLDAHIREPGLLHYPCGGDGPVEARFG